MSLVCYTYCLWECDCSCSCTICPFLSAMPNAIQCVIDAAGWLAVAGKLSNLFSFSSLHRIAKISSMLFTNIPTIYSIHMATNKASIHTSTVQYPMQCGILFTLSIQSPFGRYRCKTSLLLDLLLQQALLRSLLPPQQFALSQKLSHNTLYSFNSCSLGNKIPS